ncbi:MAG: hypothetical protein AAGF66_13545, partial [Cyanobacteria bacterium P01_H01_bin.119]
MALPDRSYQWFSEFQTHHRTLAADIEGMDSCDSPGKLASASHFSKTAPDADRDSYAAVVLARLILLAFLQGQGWLDRGDPWYLQNKLGQSQQRGPDRFYREFFQSLCLQGIALPTEERTAAIAVMIGDVPYLGGCLFQPHPLEQRYPQISIGDRSFEAILTWFSDYRWQWHEPADLNQPDPTGELAQHPPTITLALLRQSFQYFANSLTSGRPYALAPETVQATCDRVILGQLVSQLADGQNSDYHPDYQDDSQPNDG